MGEDSIKKKDMGYCACVCRVIFAVVILVKGDFCPVMIAVIALNVVGLFLASCIRAKHM